MLKNRTTWVLLAALSLMLAAGTLWALQGPQGSDEPQGPPRARMGGPGGGPMDELGLTEEQQEKLRALHTEGRKAGIRSRADMQLKRMELEELLEADEPNQAAIDKTLRELNDLRGAALKRHIDQRLGFQRLLTAEQRAKFKSFRMQRGRMFRHHMRQRFMDGPGGGERWQRRGPGSGRGEGFGRRGGFGAGGPDFDIEVEEEMELEDLAP
jgi:Spy/CpxP family protein refolding chaperone